jgi:hypothetical protein
MIIVACQPYLFAAAIFILPLALAQLTSLPPYDKEKYKEMMLDAAETVLGFLGSLALIGQVTAILRKEENGMKN